MPVYCEGSDGYAKDPNQAANEVCSVSVAIIMAAEVKSEIVQLLEVLPTSIGLTVPHSFLCW